MAWRSAAQTESEDAPGNLRCGWPEIMLFSERPKVTCRAAPRGRRISGRSFLFRSVHERDMDTTGLSRVGVRNNTDKIIIQIDRIIQCSAKGIW